jgi:hypothetical protein
MHCPACGEEHVWTVSSAWLEGEPRPVERPSKTVAA